MRRELRGEGLVGRVALTTMARSIEGTQTNNGFHLLVSSYWFPFAGFQLLAPYVFALGNKSGSFCEAVNCERSEQEGKFLFATLWFSAFGLLLLFRLLVRLGSSGLLANQMILTVIVVSALGFILWLHAMVSSYHPMVSSYGFILWLHPMVSSYGFILWFHPMVSSYGCNPWFHSSIGEQKRKLL